MPQYYGRKEIGVIGVILTRLGFFFSVLQSNIMTPILRYGSVRKSRIVGAIMITILSLSIELTFDAAEHNSRT